MNFLEKDLEQIIYETRNEILNKRNLDISGFKKRQVQIGNYGIADLITIKKPSYFKLASRHVDAIEVTIYELKQKKISVSSFLQLIRYAKGVKKFIEKKYDSEDVVINICLIGKEIDLDSDFIYLTEFVNNLSIYTYSFNIDGLCFTQHENYSLTNDGF